MSEVNKHQVGGTHYKTSYEHWDLLLDLGLGIDYLIGQATKYVSRWRKKNGVQDLQKALHFVNKLIENKRFICFEHYSQRATGEHVVAATRKEVARFAAVNQLSDQEADFCELLVLKDSESDLFQARDILLAIIEQTDRELGAGVPLSDSNKHADRVEQTGDSAGWPYVVGDRDRG